ncbi:MAG: hypothetical protein RLN69_10230 [Woeseiaceae bacterium]
MKTKLIGLTLFALTLGAVVWYPTLNAKNIQEVVKIDPPPAR